MPQDATLSPASRAIVLDDGRPYVPTIITTEGPAATERFLEFFAVTIRNPNTRRAYAGAVSQFMGWCAERGVTRLADVRPMLVAGYIEQHPGSPPTIKQHLAALRMCFDWLVTGHVIATNPAVSVHGPKHSRRRGTTPVLTPEQARHLLESIGNVTLRDVRDRALFSVMLYTFARVGAAAKLRVQDYFRDGEHWAFRLREKGGKELVLPAHPQAQLALEAYLIRTGIADEPGTPLFRSVGRDGRMTATAMTPNLVYTRVRRRARDAGLFGAICCHTFRATGITLFRKRGGSLEQAQQMAGHAQPQTTQLYDHSQNAITLAEVKRIEI